ncbi:ser/thr protein kinase-lyk4-like protein [Dermatophagoides farinae]|uniref:Ser/thr protein kinase-lyk4-like protein n=1 Tax=Dermatophagoides farinae TaxID=6954 RepID=A0A9D4P2Y5_DERFA|nr:ser/thr protein kinase-lyk4-like protein [Dermatophagoides farinae]
MKRNYQSSFGTDGFSGVGDDGDDDDDLDKISKMIHTICPNFETNNNRSIRKCDCNPYRSFIRAGPFVIGCQLTDVHQLSGIDNYIARKMYDTNPNKFYLLKIVVLPKNRRDENQSQRQAKMMIFNEYSVLSMLKNQPGVIQIRGLYSDVYFEENKDKNDGDDLDICEQYCKYLNKIGKFFRRLILAFDCHVLHTFSLITPMIPYLSNRYTRFRCEYENLQEYVKRYKSVNEMKALRILFEVVKVIKGLHEKNVAHRDLRLENILYNHRNGKILIINFGLARYVINDTTCINDHRGSSAYISPDVLKRRPYAPKPSDCWTLGVIFYSMLLGKFPFYAETFNELFKKINTGHYDLPSINVFTSETMKIMRSLIEIDSYKRININELYDRLRQIIDSRLKENMHKEFKALINQKKCDNDDLQIVPDVCQKSSTIIDRSKSPRLNIEHDHDYVIMKSNNNNNKSSELLDANTDKKSLSEFEEYLQSNQCMATPPQMPIPFLKLRERFCYDSSYNYYGSQFAHHRAAATKQQQQQSDDSQRMEIQFNSNPVNLEFPNQPTFHQLTSNSNGNRPTYDVIKVDSDVRPLNDQEYTLINRQLLRLYAPFSLK